ncbi:MAG: nucleotidyltransferase family protein [Acutalibacteraceae bacterium]
MNFGVVAEFNPFHNGHKFLVDSLKENGNNTVTAVMSESFVQRGECACLSPVDRTKAALLCGVDLVLSLPVPYATASAERFALGGVSVLGALGCVDALAFGAESANAENLKKCAEIITSEDFSRNIEEYLDQGLSFPVARQKALETVGGKELSDILSTPNNILGVEYIKAINKLNLNMEIFPIGRKGVAHDSSVENGNMCSASAIRDNLEKGCAVKKFLPEPAYNVMREEIEKGKAPANYKNLETAILYKLRSMSASDFRELPDVSEGLEYRFREGVRTSASLEEILEKVKTKRYTHSRLRRIVLCSLLGIKKEDVLTKVPYIRVLGFNEKGAQLLKTAKETASLPIITKSSETDVLGDDAKRVFALECFARDVFSLALPKADFCGKEMTDKIVII